MSMSNAVKPDSVKQLDAFLWAHSLKEWDFCSIYCLDILFVSVTLKDGHIVSRSFGIADIEARADDLYLMAKDCIWGMIKECQK